jgi:SAM-dependent methyltransferase
MPTTTKLKPGDLAMKPAPMCGVPGTDAREMRRIRRHPRPTQFDYLHLRHIRDDLARVLADVEREGGVHDVLDIFCGVRPYEDLLPVGARCTGLDIENPWGVADIVTREFLPTDIEDESYDLVLCIGGFHFLEDSERCAQEIRRILRPGGTAILTVPFAWEYARHAFEHRFTGPELKLVFTEGWEDQEIVENGSRAVTWTTITARFVQTLERRVAHRRWAKALFPAVYGAVNGAGMLLERAEERYGGGNTALPPMVLLRARRPADS